MKVPIVAIAVREPKGELQTRHKTITDFEVVRGLGRGAFGQVFMVKDKDRSPDLKPQYYAMKIIPKSNITSAEERISTAAERYILEAMDHPFIVKLHYAFQSPKKLYLLCDLMSGGQLFYLLRRSKKLPESSVKFYAAQILLALEYLHSRHIIYRDLKPQNILLDTSGHIKLTDFGLSKVCFSERQLAYSVCGTPQYIAPEVMLGKGYTTSADWFSFGSLLYDMLTGRPPFYSPNKEEILRKITTKAVPIPENLSPEVRSLLKGLFKIKPKERIGSERGAAEIKEHPFFKDIDFKAVALRQLEPPISFQEDLNKDGFDLQFEQNSIQSSMNMEKAMKGGMFDGFTYFRPDPASPVRSKKEMDNLNE